MPLLTGRVTLAFRRMAVEKLYQVMGAAHRFVRKHPAVKCMLRPAAHLVMPSIIPFRSRYISRDEYQSWMVRYETITQADDAAIRADIARFPRQPLLSVVMAPHQAPEAALRATIASLQAQIYENWAPRLTDGAGPYTHLTPPTIHLW